MCADGDKQVRHAADGFANLRVNFCSCAGCGFDCWGIDAVHGVSPLVKSLSELGASTLGKHNEFYKI
jgi:hypothetical protein